MFTDGQIDEIRRYLLKLSKKNSDFDSDTNIDGGELISMLQEGDNTNLKSSDLINYLVKRVSEYNWYPVISEIDSDKFDYLLNYNDTKVMNVRDGDIWTLIVKPKE